MFVSESVASGEKFGFAVTVDYIAIPNHPRTGEQKQQVQGSNLCRRMSGVNLAYCFVEYNTEEEARTAKRQLDGKLVYFVFTLDMLSYRLTFYAKFITFLDFLFVLSM